MTQQRTSPKTPYEIRLDLLQLSFDILQSQHSARAAEKGEKAPISAPAVEEVITEAEKMNKFISTGLTH
jgi:hypothetical protein